jgi:hypothetical protein
MENRAVFIYAVWVRVDKFSEYIILSLLWQICIVSARTVSACKNIKI